MLVFFTVFFLTLVSLAAGIYLAVQEHQTESSAKLVQTMSESWKMGFACIVGLIGGKALP